MRGKLKKKKKKKKKNKTNKNPKNKTKPPLPSQSLNLVWEIDNKEINTWLCSLLDIEKYY